MAISYRFNYRNISGYYFVILNFSNALSNKPMPDGLFNVKYFDARVDNRDKSKVPNIQSFNIEIKKQFNQFKKEKLTQFNLI